MYVVTAGKVVMLKDILRGQRSWGHEVRAQRSAEINAQFISTLFKYDKSQEEHENMCQFLITIMNY